MRTRARLNTTVNTKKKISHDDDGDFDEADDDDGAGAK